LLSLTHVPLNAQRSLNISSGRESSHNAAFLFKSTLNHAVDLAFHICKGSAESSTEEE